MTRAEFNRFFAATNKNWFEGDSLGELNDLAFTKLESFSVDEADADPNRRKLAFDWANNKIGVPGACGDDPAINR